MENTHQPAQWPQKIEKILFIIVLKSEANNIIENFGFRPSEKTHKVYTLYETTYNNK